MTTPILWNRVARPQDDGYDSFVIGFLDPHRRMGRVLTAGSTQPGYALLGAVEVKERMVPNMGDPAMMPFTPTPEWCMEQGRYLSSWQAGCRMLVNYLDEFWPFLTEFGGMGCMSGHHTCTKDSPIHAVYVSANDLNGCAQGIYHEVAHLRLESLGMGIDDHDGRLITNAPDELYTSSVRHDKKRPMSAVIHGTYAWLMFTQNDYENFAEGALTLHDFRAYSERNLAKIEKGMAEIDTYVKTTHAGDAFIQGMAQWADCLVLACKIVLA